MQVSFQLDTDYNQISTGKFTSINNPFNPNIMAINGMTLEMQSKWTEWTHMRQNMPVSPLLVLN